MTSCANGSSQRHYEVVSPVMRHYPAWELEPPEDFRCWALFLAKNAKDAVRQAVATEEFREWVTEQRSVRQPPFKGLRAALALCEHGVCWGCSGDFEETNCPECAEACTAVLRVKEPTDDR